MPDTCIVEATFHSFFSTQYNHCCLKNRSLSSFFSRLFGVPVSPQKQEVQEGGEPSCRSARCPRTFFLSLPPKAAKQVIRVHRKALYSHWLWLTRLLFISIIFSLMEVLQPRSRLLACTDRCQVFRFFLQEKNILVVLCQTSSQGYLWWRGAMQ